MSSNASALSSSSLVTAEAAADVQGDEPWNNNQVNGGEVVTPSLIDLSTGLMGFDSLGGVNTDEQLLVSPSGSESGPLFDPTTERNVTVLVGRTANLHCRVRYLGNRTVSHFK